jgi:hypothetical protein
MVDTEGADKWAALPGCGTVEAAPGTVPLVAFNATHVAVVFQPPSVVSSTEETNDGLCCRLYEARYAGKMALVDTFHFAFAAAEQCGGSQEGMMTAHLSEAGILCVAFGSGAVVFDTMRVVAHPRVVFLRSPAHPRTVTSAHVSHLPDVARPAHADQDRFDERFVTFAEDGTPTLHTDVMGDAPQWTGTLVLGTSAGECFGAAWRTGAVVFAEMVPAREPVFAGLFSNRRVIMQTVTALSGKMMPFFTEAMTHLPTSRPLALAVCGTLLFVLEKYGTVQVFSTTARRVLFPFDPPSKLIEFGRNWPVQHHYQGVHAGGDRVVVVYPNGLTRIMTIRAKSQAMIENNVDPKKRKKLHRKLRVKKP